MLKPKSNWGMDYWQQRAMAELEDEMVALTTAHSETGINNHGLIQKLFALDRAQATELRQLRAMVSVLSEMLVQSGAIDGDAMGYRMEAELDRQRAEEEETRANDQMITCPECQSRVPMARTHIGPLGSVCDTCHYKSNS